MDNNKTQISQGATQAANGGGLYGRSSDRPGIARTYIQGMKRKEDVAQNPVAPQQADPRVVDIRLQNRPVAGMLYSVSCDGCGEIFPVYVGRNTIGCQPDCDVYLTEQTVSPNHAVLLIRVIPDETGRRRVTMSLTDYDSEFGSSVDGEKLGYDRQPLSGGEIIQIGNAYKFYFVAFNADVCGLGVSRNFVPVPRVENRPVIVQNIAESFLSPFDNEVYPNAVGEEDERTFYGRTYAKKEDHSSKKTVN